MNFSENDLSRIVENFNANLVSYLRQKFNEDLQRVKKLTMEINELLANAIDYEQEKRY